MYFISIPDVPHKVENANKYVMKNCVGHQLNIEFSVAANSPFSYSKKKLAHIRQFCGVYSVGLNRYSSTKFVAHHADLTLASFNRMTNDIIHGFRENLTVTTKEGRDNLYNLKIVESGYFLLNNRFNAATLGIVTVISKSTQANNGPVYIHVNETCKIK